MLKESVSEIMVVFHSRRNYAVDGDNTKPMAQFRGPVVSKASLGYREAR